MQGKDIIIALVVGALGGGAGFVYSKALEVRRVNNLKVRCQELAEQPDSRGRPRVWELFDKCGADSREEAGALLKKEIGGCLIDKL